MLNFVWHKIMKNKGLTFSLLIGYIMAAAIVSSMPIYSHAILNRLLIKDLEKIQAENDVYPGQIYLEGYLDINKQYRIEDYDAYTQLINNELLPALDLPLKQSVNHLIATNVTVGRGIEGAEQKNRTRTLVNFSAMNGLEDHIELVGGRLPEPGLTEDGMYEVLISEKTSLEKRLSLDGVYVLKQLSNFATVKVVGIFQEKDLGDAYWMLSPAYVNGTIFLNYDVFLEDFMYGSDLQIKRSDWYFAVDYTAITDKDYSRIIELVDSYVNVEKKMFSVFDFEFYNTLKDFEVRSDFLTQTLWVIEVPILLMLLFYIFMVTRLLLQHEKNEIAVLRSRGIDSKQILLLYLIQSSMLAGIAFLTGPFLATLLCRLVGASDGFMTFVNRVGLKIEMTAEGWLYSAVSAVVLVFTMFLSVVTNKETSIVSLKRKKSRSSKPFWQKFYLDVISLAIALYGYYNFHTRQELLASLNNSDLDVSAAPVDFLLYAASTLFILGATLLFLRLFPVLIRLLYKIGEKKWGPVLYLTLSRISRSGASNLTISMFLIFTLSLGVFNSTMVRTLNQNQEDRISYNIGTDIVVQESWTTVASGESFYYIEPQFSRYEELDTIKAAARVYIPGSRIVAEDGSFERYNSAGKNKISIGADTVLNCKVMGIVPNEFGQVAWYRDDLASHHLNEYLNLLADEPRAALISSGMMEKYKLEPGDVVTLTIPGNSRDVELIVYAALDYFPTYNPNSYTKGSQDSFLVCNLIYLQQQNKLEPYEVWLAKEDDATSAQVYAELNEKGFVITGMQDSTQDLVELKNDAVLQGTNGFFTLSFLVTMVITFIGFFIYWILAIKARRLQFGILRSMGMSKSSVMMVLLWEQILVSVTAVTAGLGIGTLTAKLYAPFLENGVSAAGQVLPFLVGGERSDYLLIISIVAVMLITATIVLARIVDRLKAGEALKLGED